MWTLIKTPYLRGDPFIIFLTLMMAALDFFRWKFNINLGQLPMPLKMLYLRVVIFQFDNINDPWWREARREPNIQWLKRHSIWKVEMLVHRVQAMIYFHKKYGRWVIPSMSGATTNVTPRSSLFWRQTPGGLPVIQDHSVYSGNVFFVDDGTAQGGTTAGFGTHPDAAITDVDSANNLMTASQGDVAFMLPGHAETLATAAAWALDTVGVTFTGLGHGAAKPTFTLSATGSTIAPSAASIVIENIIVTCTAAVTKIFDSSAAHLTLHKVDYVEGSAIPLQFILTTSGSDNLEISHCLHNAKTAGASAQLWIRLIGNDAPWIHHNRLFLTLENGATDAAISGDGSVRSFLVEHNIVVQLGGTTQVSAILFTNGATGMASKNGLACGSTGIAGICDVGTAGYAVENYVLNTADKSGLLDPVVDA